MRIDILTLFPEMFGALDHSIIRRARDAGKLEINVVNFREYSKDKHKKADDYSFSGGAGLVLMAQPIVDCVENIDPAHEAHRVFLTPAAPVFTQARAVALSKKPRLLLLCGHYEGVDQRAINLCFDEVLSIGDYVLTGGEIPAMVVVDAVARHVEGVINPESLKSESFSWGVPPHTPPGAKKNSTTEYNVRHGGGVGGNAPQLLEYPQYTRPREFRGIAVPEVLLSGNHGEIDKWKRSASEEITKKYRR